VPVPEESTAKLRRIRVVGNSGTGKTTFAKRVAIALCLPHRELDDVFWAPDWVSRSNAEAYALLDSWIAEQGSDGWVLDGNWNNRLGDRLDYAPGGGPDTIVWLDYSRGVVMSRIIRRTLLRVITRQELWSGNKERVSNIFSLNPDRNIILWSWTQHNQYRTRYADFAAQDSRVIRLRSPKQADRWLHSHSIGGG